MLRDRGWSVSAMTPHSPTRQDDLREALRWESVEDAMHKETWRYKDRVLGAMVMPDDLYARALPGVRMLAVAQTEVAARGDLLRLLRWDGGGRHFSGESAARARMLKRWHATGGPPAALPVPPAVTQLPVGKWYLFPTVTRGLMHMADVMCNESELVSRYADLTACEDTLRTAGERASDAARLREYMEAALATQSLRKLGLAYPCGYCAATGVESLWLHNNLQALNGEDQLTVKHLLQTGTSQLLTMAYGGTSLQDIRHAGYSAATVHIPDRGYVLFRRFYAPCCACGATGFMEPDEKAGPEKAAV